MAGKLTPPPASMAGGAFSSAVDSNEVRAKQRNFTHPQSTSRYVQSSPSKVQLENMSTPQTFSDLCSDIRDSPLGKEITPKSSYTLSRSHSLSDLDLNHSNNPDPKNPSFTDSNLSSVKTTPIESSSLHFSPKPSFVQSNVYPQRSRSRPRNTTSPLLPNPISSLEQTLIPQEPNTNNTNRSGSSPGRKLQAVFQREGESQACEDRISNLVQSIEDEMLKSGVNVSLSQLKSHILQVREEYSNPDGAPSSVEVNLDGAFVEVGDNPPQQELPAKPTTVSNPGKTQNWASLFKAQAPSKTMKLVHYPDIQKGKEAHVEFDESQLDDGVGKHCLIGHFLDGKMPLPLLSATARAVWKDHGKFTVKQLGSCYLFEFEFEEAKEDKMPTQVELETGVTYSEVVV